MILSSKSHPSHISPEPGPKQHDKDPTAHGNQNDVESGRRSVRRVVLKGNVDVHSEERGDDVKWD